MISSEEARRRIAEAVNNLARLDDEDQADYVALEQALATGGETSKIEARLSKRTSERPGIMARKVAAERVLATAEALESENARLARIKAVAREREGLHAEIAERSERVAAALRVLEEDEGPRRRAMANDARLASELRRLRAPDITEPVGVPFERLIVPRWNSNAMGAERIELVLFSAADADEIEREAAYAASRNAAAQAQAAAPRPQAPTRRAPPPAPLVPVDEELLDL
ncbi:MAG: hypothetical protein IT186_03905 [Acidobacteria bacterium]|nr:hypothetical protein [Acidobacteriota bacterium]